MIQDVLSGKQLIPLLLQEKTGAAAALAKAKAGVQLICVWNS